MDREEYMREECECYDFWGLDSAEKLIMNCKQGQLLCKADLFFISRRDPTNI
jgi:hypothetical protein